MSLKLHSMHLPRSDISTTGIEVEVLAAPASSAPRIEEADSLGALPLFHTYADTVSMSAEARQKGIQILEVRLTLEARAA